MNRIIVDTTQEMASFANVTTRRINSIQQEVEANHGGLVALDHKFETLSDVRFGEMSSIIGIEAKMAAVASQVNSETDLLYTGVKDLVVGDISPSLIPPDVLEEAIEVIETDIKKFRQGFTLAYKAPSLYYKHSKYLVYRDKNAIYILLKAPMIEEGTLLDVYEVKSYEIPIHNSSLDSTTLMNIPQYIGIKQKSKEMFAEFSIDEIHQCYGQHVKMCPFPIVLQKKDKPTCIASIFFKQTHLIKDVCDMQYIHRNQPKPFIQQLTHKEILISHIPHIELDCTGQDVQVVKLPNIAVFQLPCSCTLSSENYHMSPRTRNCKRNTFEPTILHPVNLAYSLYFPPIEDTKIIQADTYFKSPQNASVLPEFELYKTQFDKYSAMESEGRISMNALKKSLDEHSKIYPTWLHMAWDNIISANYDGLFSSLTGILSFTSACFVLLLILSNALLVRDRYVLHRRLEILEEMLELQSFDHVDPVVDDISL